MNENNRDALSVSIDSKPPRERSLDRLDEREEVGAPGPAANLGRSSSSSYSRFGSLWSGSEPTEPSALTRAVYTGAVKISHVAAVCGRSERSGAERAAFHPAR